MKSPREVLLEWIAAMSPPDPDALVLLYHDDAEIVQVALGEPLRGRAEILESFVAFATAFPDSFTQPENIFEDGEWAILEWQGAATFSGRLGPHAPTGNRFTLRGCGFFHVVDGKIKFQRGYFDKHTWFSQIGLPVE